MKPGRRAGGWALGMLFGVALAGGCLLSETCTIPAGAADGQALPARTETSLGVGLGSTGEAGVSCSEGSTADASGRCGPSRPGWPVPAHPNGIAASPGRDLAAMTEALHSSSACRGPDARAVQAAGADCAAANRRAAGVVQELEALVKAGDGRAATELGRALALPSPTATAAGSGTDYQDAMRAAEASLRQAAESGNKAAALAYNQRPHAGAE